MMRLLVAGIVLAVTLATARASAQTPAEWQDVIRHLRHPDPAVRLDAVTRLARVAYRAAAESVAPLITDPDDRVQLAAIEAQLRFFEADRAGRARIFGIGGGSSQAQDAFEAGALRRGGAPVPPLVLDHLLQAVRDEQARVRFDAIHAFGFLAETPLSPETTARLVTELDHYDPIIRAATARVLGRLHATSTADALAAAVRDSHPVVRRYAIEALGQVGGPQTAVMLRDELHRSRGEMTGVVLLALSRIGARDDVELFRQRVADRDAALRRAAVEGLGRAGDRQSQSLIEGMRQNDRAAEVRLAAAFALHRLGEPQSHVLASMLAVGALQTQARDYLLEIGPPALPGLTAALGVATDGRHRADLVQLVGCLGSASDVAILEPMAADRDERVRRAVAHAILRLRR